MTLFAARFPQLATMTDVELRAARGDENDPEAFTDYHFAVEMEIQRRITDDWARDQFVPAIVRPGPYGPVNFR